MNKFKNYIIAACIFTAILIHVFITIKHRTLSLSEKMPPLFLNIQLGPHTEYKEMETFEEKALSTVVFAFNPAKIKNPPETWTALKNGSHSVSIPFSGIENHCVIESAAYALGNNDRAFKLFETLNTDGLLQETCADVTIALDTDIAKAIQAGKNLKMIVPEDGTLSFSLGCFKDTPSSFCNSETLLKNGYRLPDGRAPSFYPDLRSYASASLVKDTDAFFYETRTVSTDFRRKSLRIKKFSSADNREYTFSFIFTIIILTLWSLSAIHRSPSPEIMRWIIFLRDMLLVWIFLTLWKYHLHASILTRALWYSFYIFLLGLPLSLFRMMTSLDAPDQTKPLYVRGLSALYPVLLLIVFTNDYTQLIFRFDLTKNWSDDYSYGPLYLLIFAYGLFLLLFSLYLLIRKSIKSPKSMATFYPVLTALILIFYNAGYALNIRIVRESVLTINYTLFVILFLESILRSGLFPTNTNYRVLFDLSPFPMRILNQNGQCILSSLSAPDLSTMDINTILSNPGKSFFKNPDTRLRNREIKGGFAVWEEDMTPLNTLNRQIEDELISLRGINALLEKESRIRKKELSVKIQNQMFDSLEDSIEEKIERLIQATGALNTSPDKEQGLSYSTILLCHIKRYCNLFFCLEQGDSFPSYELAIYIDELSDIAEYSGHHALVKCNLEGEIFLRNAILLYDFYFEVLSWSVRKSCSTLIGTLSKKNHVISFTILSSEPFKNLIFPEKFKSDLSADGGTLFLHSLEENASVTLQIPVKGGDACEEFFSFSK